MSGAATATFEARRVPASSIDGELVGRWEQLVAHAAEPNPFFEPWSLQPALQHLVDEPVELLLVERTAPGEPTQLVGFAPVVDHRVALGATRIRQVWTHDECYLGTPLVDARWLAETVACLLRALTDDAIARIERTATSGAVGMAMLDALPELELETVSLDRYSRAFCDTGASKDADAYLDRSISHKHRKELRRQFNRLSEVAGTASLERLDDPAHLDAWVEEFLALEAKGWKGAGAAMRTRPRVEAYFRDLCRRAWSAGRLQFLALRSGTKAVAMKCNLLAKPGSFAIKICFDEDFARHSPGTHLELHNVEALYGLRDEGVLWMDSCASRRRWLVDRMWGERRPTETLLVARTRGLAGGLLHLLPIVIWVRRILRRDR